MLLSLLNYLEFATPEDYQRLFELYSKLAEQGDEWTQTKLGYMYYDGKGIPQDHKESKRC